MVINAMALKVNLSMSIDPEMVDDIDQRAVELGYASRSEYMRDLLRRDMDGYTAEDAVAIELDESEKEASA